MKTQLWLYASIFAALLGLTSACAVATDDPVGTTDRDGDGYRSSGLLLTSDSLGDTDIASMQFTIDRIDCQTGDTLGWSDTAVTDYEDMYLPGGIGVFEDAPYDSESQHIFADQYFLVDAGCYDVLTEPLDESGASSQVCYPAHKSGVSVEDGQTTEILLINQCEGADRGGLDVISTLNHPPEINDFVYQTSKFVNSCEPAPEVCVSASDADNDPLEFVWETSAAGNYTGAIAPSTISQDPQTGEWTSCAKIATGPIGDYGFDVTVFDLDGNGERLEDVLALQHDLDDHESRDALAFPVYSGTDCQGRSAVLLLAMSNNPGPGAYADRFVKRTAKWTAPKTAISSNRVLYVMDDNHTSEHPGDDQLVINALQQSFNVVDNIAEPATGLTAADLDTYDIVWFANPGFPMDDAASFDALQAYLLSGRGLILQGDDMAGPALAGGRDLSFFSHLDYIDNGDKSCGDTTNGNVGNNYDVTFSQEGLLGNLAGQSFEYGNDIDHTTRQVSGERVLASATYDKFVGGELSCSVNTTAAVAIDPINL